MKLKCVFGTLALLAATLAPAADPAWRTAGPGHEWDWSRDYAAHPDYKTEWWYVTGHLQPDEGGEALAFQATFFRVGMVPPDIPLPETGWSARDLVMAHAAVADPARGRHVFSEVLWRAVPLLGGFGEPGDTTLAWCQAPPGTDDRWRLERRGRDLHLRARDDRQGLAYDLVCSPTRPEVRHGRDGFSPKTADGSAGSLYFSLTRMEVTGTVRRGDRTVPVTGHCWLDREIFTSTLAPDQKGWDWLSLNLADGRDLMLYRLRGREPGGDFALGTLVEADGRVRSLPADLWRLEPLETWTSPETGARYPVSWRLVVPEHDIDLRLRAIMAEQENVSRLTGVHYWEGAVTAHPADDPQQESGRGFVELTGYGRDNRPPV